MGGAFDAIFVPYFMTWKQKFYVFERKPEAYLETTKTYVKQRKLLAQGKKAEVEREVNNFEDSFDKVSLNKPQESVSSWWKRRMWRSKSRRPPTLRSEECATGAPVEGLQLAIPT